MNYCKNFLVVWVATISSSNKKNHLKLWVEQSCDSTYLESYYDNTTEIRLSVIKTR